MWKGRIHISNLASVFVQMLPEYELADGLQTSERAPNGVGVQVGLL